jgi:hypothetical protein
MKKAFQNRCSRQLAVIAILTIAGSLLLAQSTTMSAGGSAPVCHFGSFTMQSSPQRCS